MFVRKLKWIFLVFATSTISLAGPNSTEPVLSCKVTTSWHHELNFTHHTFHADNWAIQQPTQTRSLRLFKQIPSSAGHSLLVQVVAAPNFQVDTIAMTIYDKNLNTEFNTWTHRKNHLSISSQFPERDNEAGERISQMDITCSVAISDT